MRKLIFAINLSVDGCCDHTKVGFGEDTFQYYVELLRNTSLIVYGRKTYELMVPYWPDVAADPTSTQLDKDFAEAFNDAKKIVFSKTLTSGLAEDNTTIVDVDLREEILRLKQEPGGDILTGGVSLPCQLIELGLVDQFNIVINPRFVGDGRRLLEGFTLLSELDLVDTTSFKSGSLLIRYMKK